MAKFNTPEEKNINYLETRYMYEQRRKLYLANEETNQTWDEADIPDVIQAWNNGWSMGDIMEYLGADRREFDLLMIDLIHQGKIDGNVHVFKPKRKRGNPMETLKMDEQTIRVKRGHEWWVCVKDVWDWIGKPAHTYRKITENWGPHEKAKFKAETNGGLQKAIFLNKAGLKRIQKHMNPDQQKMIDELLVVIHKYGFRRSIEAKPQSRET